MRARSSGRAGAAAQGAAPQLLEAVLVILQARRKLGSRHEGDGNQHLAEGEPDVAAGVVPSERDLRVAGCGMRVAQGYAVHLIHAGAPRVTG